MKLLIFLAWYAFPGLAADYYIAQSSAGLANGTSCANADAVTGTEFTTAGNWSGGKTWRLCGTFTGTVGSTMITALGSGSSGNPITILFESGAQLTAPRWSASTGAIDLNTRSYIVLDGGSNGSIVATANGSGLTYQSGCRGVVSTGGNVEIKNLLISNMYQHTSSSDNTVDQTQVNSIFFSGSNVSIHDNVISDAGWAIYQRYINGDGNVSIYRNSISRSDHGWALATLTAGGSSGPFSFYNNHVYSYANWDVTGNDYHHDGIHCFTVAAGAAAHITALNIYNNLFEGPVGASMTAHIFLEGGSGGGATPCMDSSSRAYIFNNVFLADQYIANGLLGQSGVAEIYNNTLLGKDNGGGVCAGLDVGTTFKNNVVSGCNQLVKCGTCSGMTVDYNAYGVATNGFVCNGNFYSTDQLASWRTCVGGDSNSFVNGTLLLNSNGTVQSGSPVIGAGVNLSGLGITPLNTDKAGVTRGSSWDIGAYQIVLGSTSGGPKKGGGPKTKK